MSEYQEFIAQFRLGARMRLLWRSGGSQDRIGNVYTIDKVQKKQCRARTAENDAPYWITIPKASELRFDTPAGMQIKCDCEAALGHAPTCALRSYEASPPRSYTYVKDGEPRAAWMFLADVASAQ